MLHAQHHAGSAVNAAQTRPAQARRAFGTRAAVPQPPAADGPGTWIGLAAAPAFSVMMRGYVAALRADIADASAAARQWLTGFRAYFAGLLKNRPSTAQTSLAATQAVTGAEIALFAHELRQTFVRFVAYAGAVGALIYAAAQFLEPPPVAASAELAVRPDWVAVAKPYPAFQLALPDFGEEARYAILRHADGGGRKDVMTFGEAGRSLRYAMVEIYRPGSELDRLASVPSEIAARARELGPAGEVRASLPIDTKFGPVATAEFAIGRFGVGHCIGFMLAEAEPRLQLSGLACAANQIVSRKAVACMLDRLTLISAGSDPEIAKYFAQAELKRDFCGQRDPLLYATPKREGARSPDRFTGLRGPVSLR